MSNNKEQIELAKLADQVGRYTDVVAIMKKVVELNSELTNEELNMLSVAYKNVSGAHRSHWRTISNIEQKVEGSERKLQMVKKYREKIENELKDICHEILALLDKYLLPKATTAELNVIYLKMKGDYYRYLAEIVTGTERQKMGDESQRAYENAFNVAKDKMPPTHPIRLGLVLNQSVFYYEILNQPDVACRLAHQAFDDALDNLDSMDEQSYKDTRLIMEMLRDNLTWWISD